MMGLDWAEVTGLCADLPISEMLPALTEALPGVDTVELWLWDHQMHALTAVGTGKTVEHDRRAELLDAYAATRHLAAMGHSLGYLAIGGAPTDLDDDDLDALARLVTLAVEALEPVSDVAEASRRTREMSLPAEMQWALLPPTRLVSQGAEISAAVEPAYDVGGDVFDYSIRDGHLFAAVLDARGHGLRAATIATVATNAMRRARVAGADLPELASEMAAAIGALGDEEEFVSAVLVEFDPRSGKGRWLSAGHLAPLIVTEGEVRALSLEPTLPLGVRLRGESSDPVLATFELGEDETMVLYSDGVVENAALADSVAIGDARFQAVLRRRASSPPPDDDRPRSDNLARIVVDDLMELTGARLRDDATVMTIRRLTGG